MTDPRHVHPAAPTPAEEGPGETDNAPEAVKARAGIEIGSMRYVLIAGTLLAILALGLVWAGYAP